MGWAKCRHPGCSVNASGNPIVGGLCEGCAKRRESLHISTVDEYVTTVDLASSRPGPVVNTITARSPAAGAPVRDRTSGLCGAFLAHVKFLITARPTTADIDAFVSSDQARPYPGWGTCQAAVCLSLARAPSGLCSCTTTAGANTYN